MFLKFTKKYFWHLMTFLIQLILDINAHVALFRDMLIHVGQSKDNPELREKIRKYRHICVDECRHAVDVMTDLVKSASDDDGCSLHDNSHLVSLYNLMQIFSRELIKSYRLIQVMPMDMSKLHENRSRPTNFGNVLGQLLLCKQINPDFRQEELCNIENSVNVIESLIAEVESYIPQPQGLIGDEGKSLSYLPCKETAHVKRNRLFCCISRPKYK
uniref:Uncharacterized protein n=1 Tax=Stomoxys calcitrans TaxID=35570 RepID=A0A1I8QCC6_STOCA